MKKGNNVGAGGKVHYTKPRPSEREREEEQGGEQERCGRQGCETCEGVEGWERRETTWGRGGQCRNYSRDSPRLLRVDGASGGMGCGWLRRKQEGHRCI